MKISTLDEANIALSAFTHYSKPGETYTLDRMRRLMSLLGNPQNSPKTIHVAGTAGKTSVCYFLSKMLELSGCKVGLTVSPHISHVNERVQINGTPMPESKFCSLLEEFLNIEGVGAIRPTYFEVMVAFAFWVFAKEQVDYAVVEVGLGGLVDGTNVIERQDKVCVISDIGLDHTSILGNDLSSIAAQKAGIINYQNTVFCQSQASPEAEKTIRSIAAKQNAQLFVVNEDSGNDKLLPKHQSRNWGLANKAFCYIAKRDSISVSKDHLQSKKITIPARAEKLKYQNKTFILDGAHNPLKFQALAEVLLVNCSADTKPTIIMGMLATKADHLNECLDVLKPLAAKLILTSFQSEQDNPSSSIPVKAMAKAAQKAGINNYVESDGYREAIEQALQENSPVIVVTGSLYLVGAVRREIMP